MLSRVQPFNVCRLQYYSFAICYLALGVNYFEALSTFFFVLKLKISCNVVLSLCDFLVLVVFSYLNRSKYLAFLFFFLEVSRFGYGGGISLFVYLFF